MRAQRLFIAAYPEPDVVGALLAMTRARIPDDARMVDLDQLHLTLLFIGSVRRPDVPVLIESMDRSVSGREPCAVRLVRLACLPDGEQPRLVAALGTADAGLVEIQKRLAARLARFRPNTSREQFVPHLTLARLVPGASRMDGIELVPIEWKIREIRLVESRQHADGVSHAIVHSSILEA